MSTLESTIDGAPEYRPHDTQHSPVVLYQLKKRSDDWQLRLADQITAFAGSMAFVWWHVAIFALWIASGLFGTDRYPFQFLTFIVSLEAIFLSTFVLIGQNRQAGFQQAKADHDFHTAESDLNVNTELTRAIHAMTKEIHTLIEEVRQKVGDVAPPTGHRATLERTRRTWLSTFGLGSDLGLLPPEVDGRIVGRELVDRRQLVGREFGAAGSRPRCPRAA